ncbi:hypothetical protein E3N88_14733 [Mikania micrantha]|uniref:Uncharacterized protein n=1 Tax=Mikania micrantha TaxID=192012 RepID=A0A5N6P483_9ASTR|nr:hypothetical protein E3N88_14733 [Mikania micrantha]
MRRVRRRDAIETVTITTAALGFDCGGRRRRDATKTVGGDGNGRRLGVWRRWQWEATAVGETGDGSGRRRLRGDREDEMGVRRFEDDGPPLFQEEVSQTFFNEMSARKQTSYIFPWSAGSSQSPGSAAKRQGAGSTAAPNRRSRSHRRSSTAPDRTCIDDRHTDGSDNR